ncbi:MULTISPECIES: MerR family transcriptional regulator [unclassified Ruegeria]|uniref:MerR family transcriptional regulator n=1 Tax=unclassified Ruegeria TaxID=2625375 RepID=UPI001487F822|nr:MULTISPECIES: MerR family transcriptional regulator [unclassified Ruegeria]
MANVFNDDRVYFPEDPEMQLLGNREKLAQWRHRMCGPAFIRIGRRIRPVSRRSVGSETEH